jgi:hypothetical protein
MPISSFVAATTTWNARESASVEAMLLTACGEALGVVL